MREAVQELPLQLKINKIKLWIKRNRFQSIRQLACDLNVSKDTLCRPAQETKLLSRVAVKNKCLIDFKKGVWSTKALIFQIGSFPMKHRFSYKTIVVENDHLF